MVLKVSTGRQGSTTPEAEPEMMVWATTQGSQGVGGGEGDGFAVEADVLGIFADGENNNVAIESRGVVDGLLDGRA